jgi:hypothetical protein
MQYVYAIGPVDGPFKIGIASDLRSRLSALQTGSPVRLKIHISAVAENAREAESNLHRMLAVARLGGEWFSTSIAAVADAFCAIGLCPIGDVKEHDHGGMGMTGDSFCKWLEEMSRPPFERSEEGCAAALGVPVEAIAIMKQNGADRRTALACRAVLHMFEPFYGS